MMARRISFASPDPLRFRVQDKLCETCIYRPGHLASRRTPAQLEAEVADPVMPGFFKSYRQCHHSSDRNPACCRGFWNRHKDRFTLGQLAQRLGLVEFVSIDVLKKGKSK